MDALETVQGEVKIAQEVVTPKGKRFFEVVVGDSSGIMSAKWFKYHLPYLKAVFHKGQRIILSGQVQLNPYTGHGKEMIHPDYESLGDEEESLIHTGRIVPIYPATEGFNQKTLRGIMKQIVDQYAPLLTESLPEYLRRKLGLLPVAEAVRQVHFPDSPQTDVGANCIRPGGGGVKVSFPQVLAGIQGLATNPGFPITPSGMTDQDQSATQPQGVCNTPLRTDRDIVDQLNQGISPAHRRLVFEEFFLLELGLARRHRAGNERPGISFAPNGDLESRLRQMLGFEMTSAQERVLREIKQAMQRPSPMNRLLQGDVGSGKTAVAMLAIALAIENGYQAAVMVPTEILAEQHYLNLHLLLDKAGVKTLLLKGDMKAAPKKAVYEQISSGVAQVVIGTHAVIQQGVEFARLGLVVIDEQHRFGVMQRANLIRKAANGVSPDVLVMTATPIPRSLALTVYGDLELSVIDEMPAGRIPVKTRLCYEKDRSRIYQFINDQVMAGAQAFVVYPLVEESEKSDLKAASEMYLHLQQDIFPHLKLDLLHGRMVGAEKEEIMRRFKAREIHLLVATTVVEVGIDIPHASVMGIEHAERFGLAQLHQLRGRVGRRGQQGYCILLAQYPLSDEARARLNAMVTMQDGFQIAEADLKLRGPGEFLGLRQSGLPDLKLANILRDASLLETARKEAFDLLERDPHLKQPENQPLRHAVLQKWKNKLELLQVG